MDAQESFFPFPQLQFRTYFELAWNVLLGFSEAGFILRYDKMAAYVLGEPELGLDIPSFPPSSPILSLILTGALVREV